MADGISYAPVSRQTIHEWLYYMRGLNALQMEDYTGWQTLGDYMALLDRRNVQNAITQIPYANVRSLICGWGSTAPDDSQMKLIQMQVEQGMDEGACGLSTGLDYAAQCFASTAELVAACLPMAEARGLYVTHMRYKIGTLAALKEAVEIGRRAGVPVHISHLKAANEADTEAILSYVDQVAVNEVDFFVRCLSLFARFHAAKLSVALRDLAGRSLGRFTQTARSGDAGACPAQLAGVCAKSRRDQDRLVAGQGEQLLSGKDAG